MYNDLPEDDPDGWKRALTELGGAITGLFTFLSSLMLLAFVIGFIKLIWNLL